MPLLQQLGFRSLSLFRPSSFLASVWSCASAIASAPSSLFPTASLLTMSKIGLSHTKFRPSSSGTFVPSGPRDSRSAPETFSAASSRSGRAAAAPSSGAAAAERRGANFTFNTGGLGQHILKNMATVDNIIAHAAIKSSDTVLEIGPGTGNLTAKLLPLAKKVVVVEFDPRMVVALSQRLSGTEHGHKLEIIHGDVLKVELPKFDVCVSNLPYNISSPVTFKLLTHRPLFRCAILMYQLEFAQRLCARAGSENFSRLTLNAQLLGKIDHLMKIDRNNFRPPPKVESAVIRVEPHNPPPPVNYAEWDGLLRIAFLRKNKTIAGNFKVNEVEKMMEQNYRTYHAVQNLPCELNSQGIKEAVARVLTDSGMGEKRAAKMTQDDFLRLLAAFNSAHFHFT